MSNSIPELAADLLTRLPAHGDNQQYWVGIAGAPGSGKSTLSYALKDTLGEAVAIIPMDGYHNSRHELDAMSDPARAHARRGAPFTFNAERFVTDMLRARESGVGAFPDFDHGTGDPVEDSIQLVKGQTSIVLVEGNYLLLDDWPWCRLREDVFHESWFLDVPIDVCRQRVYERHLSTGKSIDEAKFRINDNDGPNAELVARVSMRNADRIICFD